MAVRRRTARPEHAGGAVAFAPPSVVTVGDHPALVWQFDGPLLAVSSTPLGGGIGLRRWVLNVQVPSSYDRLDASEHLQNLAYELDLEGPGIGFLTAAAIDRWTTATEKTATHCLRTDATVGISKPTWAAADHDPAPAVGTINLVARSRNRLADAALINAVATVTEAKTQALLAAGVDGTGTATDAVCILCPPDGPAEPFAGPRSAVGAPLARASFAAVLRGIDRTRGEPSDPAEVST